jgi:hypothetical protein
MIREKRAPKPVIMHWLLPGMGITRGFCGQPNIPEKLTEDKDKVTCKQCRRQMRLHGYLPEEN